MGFMTDLNRKFLPSIPNEAALAFAAPVAAIVAYAPEVDAANRDVHYMLAKLGIEKGIYEGHSDGGKLYRLNKTAKSNRIGRLETDLEVVDRIPYGPGAEDGVSILKEVETGDLWIAYVILVEPNGGSYSAAIQKGDNPLKVVISINEDDVRRLALTSFISLAR